MTKLETPTEKPKFPRAEAIAVVKELMPALREATEKIIVAGSLRRRKERVGDIEILYVPKMIKVADPADMFGNRVTVNAADRLFEQLIDSGAIEKRENKNGSEMWGESNKFARHTASGIPIDFFATDYKRWYNMLVCRTGGMFTNIHICQGAIDIGWQWLPYREGFMRRSMDRGGPAGCVDIMPMNSEEAVFEFARLPYKEPWDRE